MNIDVVDIGLISLTKSQPVEDDFRALLQPIKEALTNIGFIYITNHGIEQELIDKAMEASMEFFKMDEDIKTRYTKGEDFQGWVAIGREVLAKALETQTAMRDNSASQGGGVENLEVRETYDLKNISPSGKFPDKECPDLRARLSSLVEAGLCLSERLLRCISLCLGQPSTFLQEVHKGMVSQGTDVTVPNATTLRSLHYPPIPESLASRSGIIRCGEHSDYGTITILFQDKQGGLEVKDTSGSWIPAPPIPGALLVNVGDLLENLSSGEFKATKHRVLVPSDEHLRLTPRQSLALFVHPDDSVVCSPLAGPHPEYPPVTAIQHLLNRFATTYGDRL